MGPTVFPLGSFPSEGNDVLAGSIIMFGGADVPAGYLACDGGAYAIAGQPVLYSAIGHTWDSHRGQTAPGAGFFRVPFLDGLVPVCAGEAVPSGPVITSSRAVGSAGGAEAHALSEPELAAHSHDVTDPGHTHTTDGGLDFLLTTGGLGKVPATGAPLYNQTETIQSAATGISLESTGESAPHNTMQPFGVVAFIIKA